MERQMFQLTVALAVTGYMHRIPNSAGLPGLLDTIQGHFQDVVLSLLLIYANSLCPFPRFHSVP